MKLYVGNLPYSTSENELKEAFSPYGEVISVTLVQDRVTGRSRGFGFVEMADESTGNAAIAALNGKDFGGRNLVVNEARPRTEQKPARGGPFRRH